MTNPDQMEDPLVQLLLEEQLITPAQAKRLARNLEKGMDPNAAVHSTPLVEPVKLASVLSRLRETPPPMQRKEETPPPPPPPPPAEAPPRKEFTPIAGDVIDAALELDEIDLLPVDLDAGEAFSIKDLGPVGAHEEREQPSAAGIDVHEVDLELNLEEPSPPEGKAPKEPEGKNADSGLPSGFDLEADFELPEDHSPAGGEVDLDLDLDLDVDPPPDEAEQDRVIDTDIVSALDDAFENAGGNGPPAGEGAQPESMEGFRARPVRESRRDDVPATLKAPEPMEHYAGSGRVNTYNLFDDEGINLIHEVNKVLLHVMEITGQGLVLDRGTMDNNYRIYNSRWALEEQRTIPEHELEKMINRIRVMARLEPWKRNQDQAGQCLVTAGGNTTRLLVESLPLGVGKEVLTVYFVEE